MLRMRSRSLDRIKSAARSRTSSIEEAAEHRLGSAAPTAPLATDASRVHEALAGLPDEQRAIVELGYFEGLSGSEMAARLGIPIGTVKSRLHAAMKKLRVAFSSGSEEAHP